MRWSVLIVALMLAIPAQAEPLELQRLKRWLWPQRPVPPPVVVQTVPLPPAPAPPAPLPPPVIPPPLPPPVVEPPAPPPVAPHVVKRNPAASTAPRVKPRVASRPQPSAEPMSWWCSMVCSHVRGKTLAQLKSEGGNVSPATVSAGKKCVQQHCPNAIRN